MLHVVFHKISLSNGIFFGSNIGPYQVINFSYGKNGPIKSTLSENIYPSKGIFLPKKVLLRVTKVVRVRFSSHHPSIRASFVWKC